MQKYPYISIFTSKKDIYIVPHTQFRNSMEMWTVMCAGLVQANNNEFKRIERVEEGSEKIEFIFDDENKKIDLESTVDKFNLIYILSELIKRLIKKETSNVQLTFWAENREISVINYKNVDIITICAVTVSAIQKVAAHRFYKTIKKNHVAIIELQTNINDEILIESTEEQERTLTILIESLLNAVKIII